MIAVNAHSDGQPISITETIAQQVQHDLPETTRPVQDRNLLNHHEHTCCREIEMIRERSGETRDHLVISIKEKLDQVHHKAKDISKWGKLCIYKVPHYLNEDDDKSYHPQTVSIGPYHHGKKHLQSMERHKWRALDMVLERTDQGIEVFIDAMRELEEKARACYEGPIDLSVNEFAEMLLLDGCFVLEIFIGNDRGFQKTGYARNDPVFAMRGLMHSIQRDMIMLENQLPLFVLNRLLDIQLGREKTTGMVAELAVKFFDPLMPTGEALAKSDDKGCFHSLDVFRHIGMMAHSDRQLFTTALMPSGEASTKQVDQSGDFHVGKEELHCLDVFRQSFIRSSTKSKPKLTRTKPIWYWKTHAEGLVADKRQQQLVHCVTELKDAGIKFRRGETDRFWDIKFRNGYLEIPKLLIHDGTKSLFSNLIAFEQCCNDTSNKMTSYIIFMDNLINSSEDVSYLHYCDIVEHWLGSDSEVADLFNRLCREVVFNREDSYLSKLSDDVNLYYKRKWNVWRAILKHKYFNNPWAYLSFFAAVTLLLLTFTQSFYAVYAYYKPNS